MDDIGASAEADQALAVPVEPASGLAPSGFDPSRIAEIVAAIEPKTLQPIIKRASDEFYEAMLTAVDYYLRENLEYNLGSHIQMLERENQRMRTELWEVDRTIGGIPLGHEGRLHAIALLDLGSRNHAELLYQVSRKYDGETRHETALRYLRDRDRSGEADETRNAARARAEGIAQPSGQS